MDPISFERHRFPRSVIVQAVRRESASRKGSPRYAGNRLTWMKKSYLAGGPKR